MAPTFEWSEAFGQDLNKPTDADRERFRSKVLNVWVPVIDDGPPYPPGLRIKRVQGTPHVWEFTFAPDGRATFEFGEPRQEGLTHILWRRIGTHGILSNP
jgi:hypothetical protein